MAEAAKKDTGKPVSATESGRHQVSLAVMGSGGAGIITIGEILLRAAGIAGLYGLMTRSTGPQIRGGEVAALLTLSSAPVGMHQEVFDLVLAVDWLNADRFAADITLTETSLVVGDDTVSEQAPDFVGMSGARRRDLSLKQAVEETKGGRINMVTLGCLCALVDLPIDALEAAVREKLADKGNAVVDAGLASVAAGAAALNEGGEKYRGAFAISLPEEKKPRWIISGNEAAGLGAVHGGVRFAAAYPITPATEVLEWLAPALDKVGGTLVQAEDELASINMIIGSSYAGVPSITATSGPGLALMIESIGLAASAEVPVVIIDVMRGGPSTGIPTKSEQSDLNIAVYGLHGDAPHIVVAPSSIGDCLFTTQWAVHLAEATQAPAIVLSDQFIGQAKGIVDQPANVSFLAARRVADRPGEEYHRYALTADGVSPMALPGTPGGQYTADGLEHSPRGTPSSRAEDHAAQLAKRRLKIEALDYGDHWAVSEGDGPVAVLSWGSTFAAVQHAAALARDEGIAVKTINLRLLSPAQPARMSALLDGVSTLIVAEQSEGAQFHRYLRAHYDLPASCVAVSQPGPLPIRSSDVLTAIREAAKS